MTSPKSRPPARQFRTALITGGSTGIGLAIAEELAKAGTRVAIAARRPQSLEEAARRIGEGTITIAADLGDSRAAARVVDEAASRLGGLDLVIANAGVGGNRPAESLRIQDIEPILRLNVLGACATITAAIPHLLSSAAERSKSPKEERGAGGPALVGISSIAGYRGLPGGAAYSASKAALSTFLESIRVDLRGTGITVTDVRPGFIDTPLTQRNRFRMPFLMPADEAGRRIVKAIRKGTRIYAFPWPMALGIRVVTLLPAWVYERIGSRVRVEKSLPEEGESLTRANGGE